jgi:hypothetical protein
MPKKMTPKQRVLKRYPAATLTGSWPTIYVLGKWRAISYSQLSASLAWKDAWREVRKFNRKECVERYG